MSNAPQPPMPRGYCARCLSSTFRLLPNRSGCEFCDGQYVRVTRTQVGVSSGIPSRASTRLALVQVEPTLQRGA